MPAADLLSFGLLHLGPVGQLLLAGAVQAQRDPADHLLPLHAALVVDGQDERDVRKLEQRHLEDEGLLVGGVGLAPADGRLALGHFVAHGVEQGQLNVGVWRRSRSRRRLQSSRLRNHDNNTHSSAANCDLFHSC